MLLLLCGAVVLSLLRLQLSVAPTLKAAFPRRCTQSAFFAADPDVSCYYPENILVHGIPQYAADMPLPKLTRLDGAVTCGSELLSFAQPPGESLPQRWLFAGDSRFAHMLDALVTEQATPRHCAGFRRNVSCCDACRAPRHWMRLPDETLKSLPIQRKRNQALGPRIDLPPNLRQLCRSSGSCYVRFVADGNPNLSLPIREIEFVPLHYSLDTELTQGGKTTQAVLAEYIARGPPRDICVLGIGAHDEGLVVSGQTDEMFVEGVRNILNAWSVGCRRFVWIHQHGPRLLRPVADMRQCKERMRRRRFLLETRVLKQMPNLFVLDPVDMSEAYHVYCDNLHSRLTVLRTLLEAFDPAFGCSPPPSAPGVFELERTCWPSRNRTYDLCSGEWDSR